MDRAEKQEHFGPIQIRQLREGAELRQERLPIPRIESGRGCTGASNCRPREVRGLSGNERNGHSAITSPHAAGMTAMTSQPTKREPSALFLTQF